MRPIDADALKKQAITLVTGTRTWEVVTVSDLDNALTVDTYTEEDVQYAIKEGHQVGYEMAKAKFERPQGEWIPISERLPHAEYGESDTVLVSACWKSDKDLKDKAIFVTEAYFDGSCFRRPTGEVYWNIKVIAWMPLPEPYKEEENE